MLLILKQKRVARAGALKALDFATTRSPANCERCVDQFGLKTIFAIFMGKGKVGAPPAELSGQRMSGWNCCFTDSLKNQGTLISASVLPPFYN